VADRFDARRVFAVCAIASAVCAVAAMVGARADGYGALWAWRAAAGFCLAGIYPVGMKLAAQRFAPGLGWALGLLVGALVLGSASAHALRALVEMGHGWPWRAVFGGTAVASLVAAALVRWGLEPVAAAPAAGPLRISPRDLRVLWTDVRLRASVFGYFGHMLELYTLWVLVPLVLLTRLSGAALSWAAFAVLGVGCIGCVAGGWLAARLGPQGSARVAGVQLAASGSCCLLSPWALQAGDAAFAAWLLLWGITVVGDSPQFSALTARNAPPAAVGSVLTLTNSIGFALSIASIQLFVSLAVQVPLAQLLPWLAVGPVLGLWALAPLWRGEGSRGAGAGPRHEQREGR
jgi:MFS family permease